MPCIACYAEREYRWEQMGTAVKDKLKAALNSTVGNAFCLNRLRTAQGMLKLGFA
jgi:hypothetical protein